MILNKGKVTSRSLQHIQPLMNESSKWTSEPIQSITPPSVSNWLPVFDFLRWRKKTASAITKSFPSAPARWYMGPKHKTYPSWYNFQLFTVITLSWNHCVPTFSQLDLACIPFPKMGKRALIHHPIIIDGWEERIVRGEGSICGPLPVWCHAIQLREISKHFSVCIVLCSMF